MVGKLLKHELHAIFRILAVLAAAVFVFAAVGRLLIALGEQEPSGVLSVLSVLIVFFYVFAIMAIVFAAWGLGIASFSRSLFRGEGYMTFSIPASPAKIVGAKLLAAIIGMVFGAAVSGLSLLIFFIGAAEGSATGFVWEIFSMLFEALGTAIQGEPVLCFEIVCLALVSLPLSLLVVYTCLSVGQLFTAHRKLYTFLIFFGGYILAVILGEFCLTPILEAAAEVSDHLALWIEFAVLAALDVLCWFLTLYILKRKVNLL